MCHETTMRVPTTPPSIHTARAFVADHLEAWGAVRGDVAEDPVADAVLVTSELVSNAVQFGTDELELSLIAHGDHIEIAVTDDNPRAAQLKPSDPLRPGGLGLVLVDTLAGRWGQRHHDGRKTVWARLSLPPGSALARGCRRRAL